MSSLNLLPCINNNYVIDKKGNEYNYISIATLKRTFDLVLIEFYFDRRLNIRIRND